jgi:hypothetical protein
MPFLLIRYGSSFKILTVCHTLFIGFFSTFLTQITIIIGNGFDLAHGLKTKYKDFIEYILESERNNVINKLKKTDINSQYYYDDGFIFVNSPGTLSSMLNNNSDLKGISFYDGLKKLKFSERLEGKYLLLDIQYKNYFFKELIIKNDLENWVDIEYEYYKALMDCVNNKRKHGINTLNDEFSHITKALESHLSSQMKNEFMLSEKIVEKLTSIIKPVEVSGHYANNLDDNILILNFNYTNVIEKYLDTYFQFCRNSIKCIFIHGQLENQNNKIIFGYGDELDNNYKLIENTIDNKYLDNVKSIKYSETRNYKELLEFIDSNEYEIFIMGHSCGISDKTLLNTLFEHKNCLLIKIFYHKINEDTDNYSDVYKNISRIFTGKPLMRKIVVNKEDCVPLT